MMALAPMPAGTGEPRYPNVRPRLVFCRGVETPVPVTADGVCLFWHTAVRSPAGYDMLAASDSSLSSLRWKTETRLLE
jgi:hypothetical protein